MSYNYHQTFEPKGPLSAMISSHQPSSINSVSASQPADTGASASSLSVPQIDSRSSSPTGISNLIAEALGGRNFPSLDTSTFQEAKPATSAIHDDMPGLIAHNGALQQQQQPVKNAGPMNNGHTYTNNGQLSRNPSDRPVNGSPKDQQPSAPLDIDAPPLPQYMIFGRAADDLEHIIPQRNLQVLPKEPLQALSARGKKQGVIVMMDNYEECESMIRLKQFLETTTYQPFKPKTALEYQDTQIGGTQTWTSQKDTETAVITTENTQQLFRREIDFYLFAAGINYYQLRQICAENICLKYPKSVKCIWVLVEKVFNVAAQLGDDGLVQHITTLVNKNCKEVAALPQYIPYMRQLVTADGLLGRILLESYISASGAAQRKVLELTKKEAASKSLWSTPKTTNGDAHVKKEAVPPASPAAASRGLTPNGLACRDLDKVAEAIHSQTLLICLEDGYGTLSLQGLPGRNRDFTFQRGELLLAKAGEPSLMGHNNVVVYNSRGERGDILRTLTRKVPAGLGVLAKGELIYVPRESHGGDPTPDRPFSRSHQYYPDREQRTSTGGGKPQFKRSRSQSPAGVLKY